MDSVQQAPQSIWEQGNYAPVMQEIDAGGLAVQGTLPPGLSGTLFRIGPNPRFPSAATHWFGGDGMIHAISLTHGAAAYRNRWVRTPKWRDEDRAGRPLFRTFAGKVSDAPDWAGDDRGVANTHIVWHAGQLLALEEAHWPTGIMPRTLETLGYAQYAGEPGAAQGGADSARQRGPFTAHPKIDPHTGEMFFFGYNADGPFTPAITVGTIAPDGRITRQFRFDAPYCSMVHDFMMTERHLLIPILPLTGSRQRAEQKLPAYAFEGGRSSMIGVLDRDGPSATVRWYEGPACYVFHTMNAWQSGNSLLADVMVYEEPPLFPRPDGSPGDPARQQAYLARWTFDLTPGSGTFTQQRLCDVAGEFPRIDDRYAGRKYRYGWFAASRPGESDLSGIVHVDVSTGASRAFWLPPGDVTSESVFAARGDAEGDGWILAVVWRAASNTSELLVLDAGDIAAGPVATVALPQRVPFGFHGNWVAGDCA